MEGEDGPSGVGAQRVLMCMMEGPSGMARHLGHGRSPVDGIQASLNQGSEGEMRRTPLTSKAA